MKFSDQILHSFRSDKDRRTDSRIRRKKHTAAPPLKIEPRILQIPVARSNHWATKPQRELRVNFRLSPSCQFLFHYEVTRIARVYKHATTNNNSLDLDPWNASYRWSLRTCRLGQFGSPRSGKKNWQLGESRKFTRISRYYYYYSLLHHTSQKKAITKGEGEKPGVWVSVCVWVCACACVCACVRICLGTSICKVESTIVLRHFHEPEWEYKEWIWLNTGSRLNRVREKLYQWVPIWHSL